MKRDSCLTLSPKRNTESDIRLKLSAIVWKSENWIKQLNHRFYIKLLCIIHYRTNNVKFIVTQMLRFLEFGEIFKHGKLLTMSPVLLIIENKLRIAIKV